MSVSAEKPAPAVAPEERFWQRYSARHELPLSGVGSLSVHALIIGALILMALGFIRLQPAGRRIQVETVEVSPSGEIPRSLPSGGLHAGGIEDPPGIEDPDPPIGQIERPAVLTPRPPDQPKIAFPNPSTKPEGRDGIDAEIRRLNEEIKGKPSLQKRGPGVGVGPSGGTSPLTTRQERMLRWHLTFNTRDGGDYVRQLQLLGAILAIPKGPRDAPTGYFLVRDLARRPAILLDEDVSQILRISWVDNRPDSVRSVLTALGIAGSPNHIRAYFPKSLEDKLLKLEHDYQRLPETSIDETWFEVLQGQLKVAHQTKKR